MHDRGTDPAGASKRASGGNGILDVGTAASGDTTPGNRLDGVAIAADESIQNRRESWRRLGPRGQTARAVGHDPVETREQPEGERPRILLNGTGPISELARAGPPEVTLQAVGGAEEERHEDAQG